jgi:hypothetical protein
MIYDTVISTGDASVSGCSSKELGTDTFSSGDLIAGGAGKNYYFNTDLVTGQRNMRLTLNGQTLLQEIPVTGDAQNFVFYSNDTGDFFIKGQEAPENEQNKLFFDSTTRISSNSNIVYNVVTGGNIAGINGSGQNLKSGINGEYFQNAVISDFDYYINGQKAYSGFGFGFAMMVGGTEPYDFYPNFGTSPASNNGIITEENKDKFKLTAYKKPTRTHQITGVEPDVFGSGFIEGRNKYYINGIQQPPSNYLEFHTGVSIIETGLSCLISGEMHNLTVTSLTL